MSLLQLPDIPIELHDMIDEELYDNEQIKWAAQPKPLWFLLSAIPIFLFGIPWTGFVLFWIWGASNKGKEPFGFCLFGLVFLFFGIMMLLSPMLAYLKSKKVVYVITNIRAIIFIKGKSVQIESFGAERIQGAAKIVRADGSGDLIFKQRDGYYNPKETEKTKNGFLGVERVTEVERILNETIRTQNEDKLPLGG